MIKLNNKIILHIPECFHNENKLIPVPNYVFYGLYNELQSSNYDFYVTSVQTYYKGRGYTTRLITLYTLNDDKKPIIIFKDWFQSNNDELRQESLAYEYNNTLIIEDIK